GFMLDRIVGKKKIGIKQCMRYISEGIVLYVAKDADSKLISPLIQLANEKNIKIVEISTMKELGKMSSIDVNCAATLSLEE
ncbi:MAG: ribosomal L7Ae/L30e/S12e/Gadd45 family protein, partial [Cetobacterium sp.]